MIRYICSICTTSAGIPSSSSVAPARRVFQALRKQILRNPAQNTCLAEPGFTCYIIHRIHLTFNFYILLFFYRSRFASCHWNLKNKTIHFSSCSSYSTFCCLEILLCCDLWSALICKRSTNILNRKKAMSFN